MDINDNEIVSGDIKQKIEKILAKHDIKLNEISEDSQSQFQHNNENHISSESKEISLNDTKSIFYKLDEQRQIVYVSDFIVELSGYNPYEIVNKKIDFLRHPDMPQLILQTTWERLNNGESIFAIVKNISKSGKTYWTLAYYQAIFDNDGQVSYHIHEKVPPPISIPQIDKFYNTLKSIEKAQDIDVAKRYLIGKLEEMNMTYDSYFIDILGFDNFNLANFFKTSNKQPNQPPKKNMLKRIFGK